MDGENFDIFVNSQNIHKIYSLLVERKFYKLTHGANDKGENIPLPSAKGLRKRLPREMAAQLFLLYRRTICIHVPMEEKEKQLQRPIQELQLNKYFPYRRDIFPSVAKS